MDVPATPDPVGDPVGYQRLLLSLLGGDDPAALQAATPATLRALVSEAGGRLRAKPKPGEWSVLEVLGHIHDAEIAYSGRYRWILAHDEPPLIAATTRISGWNACATTRTTPRSCSRCSRPSARRTSRSGRGFRSPSGPASACTRSAVPRATTSRSG